MATIHIQGTDVDYSENDIILFEEGLIGLPHLHRLILISQEEITPFLWLASIEDPVTGFVVLEPHEQFAGYTPCIPSQVQTRLGLTDGEPPLLLAIARITTEWQQSTLNLRAPLIIAPGTMRGMQLVLTGSDYQINQPLA